MNTSQTFTVKNSGSETGNYTLTTTCSGGASSCSAPSSVQIASGQSASVAVSYHTAIGPTTGTVSLQAVATENTSYSSSASSTVNVAALPSNVMTNNTLPGWTGLERSDCVAIAIVKDVAAQCDAFRILHPLPAVTTRAKARVPTLVYYSDWVTGPGVSASVSVPTSITTIPDSVQFNVYRPNPDSTLTLLQSRSYGWAVDGFGRSPQELSIPNVTTLTGIFYYRLEVRFKSGTGAWQTNAQVDGSMLAADRSSSSFGAGWWLEGVEQLVFNQGGSPSHPDVAWIGGDGSMRQYAFRQTNAAGDVYTADLSPDRPDTLIKDAADTLWTRPDGNNVRVLFDAHGHHVLTINRVGDSTRMAWNSSVASRLDTLIVPGGLKYVFLYDVNNRLTTINAPGVSGSRPVQFSRQLVNGSATDGIHSITDPSQDSVTFEYAAAAPGTAISARTDRRLVRTQLDWESSGPGLADASTPDGNGTTVTQYFRNPANVGMAAASKPISTDSLYLRYTNPRGYGTSFYLSPLGSPTRIVNALGQTTTITYSNAQFPGLATQVVRPGGLTTQAFYDSRGLLDTTTVVNPLGDGRNATTVYSWDPKWNMVTGVHSPGGVSDSISYDATTGDRMWEQDGRGSVSRVNYGYDSQNRLISVQPPGNSTGQLETIAYDPSLGNVSSVTTASGYVTRYYADGIGRTTLTNSQIDTLAQYWDSTRTTYNSADEVDSTISYGPAIGYTLQAVANNPWSSPVHAETLYVKHLYDAEGNLTNVYTMPTPADTAGDILLHDSYGYDGLGRTTSHTIDHGGYERRTYDAAGNVATLARPAGTLTYQYDALNRVTTQVMPARTYARQYCDGWPLGPVTGPTPGTNCFEVYPAYPSDSTGTGYFLMADTARFTYDANTGFMLTADNRYAKVHRSYYPNGAIYRDSLYVLNGPTWLDGTIIVGTSYQGYTYGITKQYNIDGKDSVLSTPASGNIGYYYRTDNGALDSIADPSGNWFRYVYDGAGRVDSLVIGPSGGAKSIWETRTYDADGRQTRRIRKTSTKILLDESFWFDAKNRPIKVGRNSAVNFNPDTSHFVYSGLGAVQARDRIDELGNWESEEYRVDALGNNLESRMGSSNGNVQDPRYWQYTFHGELTGRNTSTPQKAVETFTEGFDGSGGMSQRFLLTQTPPYTGTGQYTYPADEQVRAYYDIANRLRALQRYNILDTLGDARGTFDEYEYDALGRRIVVISRRAGGIPACNPLAWTCITTLCQPNCKSSLTRYMWDGSEVLVEDRQAIAPSSDGPDDGYVTYINGLDLDHPVGVIDARLPGNLRVPHPTWRGQYESSSTAAGDGADCTLTTGSCETVAWNATPAMYNVANPFEASNNLNTTYTWVGGLLLDQQDASGLLYRRNRYYDPISGRFTQEDPIGLAGGLNTYGFAGGDPVNYSDPFGLCTPRWICDFIAGVHVGVANPSSIPAEVDQSSYAFKLGKGSGMLANAINTMLTLDPKGELDPKGLPGSHNLPCTSKQFGKKFGEHMDANRPGYRTPQEYRELANQIYNDPNATRVVYPADSPIYPGETQITSGGNVLRLDPHGNFRSLYPVGSPPGSR